jgi:hypothetical protein
MLKSLVCLFPQLYLHNIFVLTIAFPPHMNHAITLFADLLMALPSAPRARYCAQVPPSRSQKLLITLLRAAGGL